MVQEFVVDTSALIQAYLKDSESLRAVSLLYTLFEDPPARLHVLEFGIVKCVNIMWKRVTFGGMALPDMQKALVSLEATPLSIHPLISLLPRALEIGVDYRLAIYDSLYLALAKKLRCPLITVDVRQSAAAAGSGLSLKSLMDFPEYQQLVYWGNSLNIEDIDLSRSLLLTSELAQLARREVEMETPLSHNPDKDEGLTGNKVPPLLPDSKEFVEPSHADITSKFQRIRRSLSKPSAPSRILPTMLMR